MLEGSGTKYHADNELKGREGPYEACDPLLSGLPTVMETVDGITKERFKPVTLDSDRKTAQAFRDSITAHCPTVVCAACSCYTAPKDFGDEDDPSLDVG